MNRREALAALGGLLVAPSLVRAGRGPALGVWHVDDGEQWWYVAESADHALRQHFAAFFPFGLVPDDLRAVDATDYIGCPLDEIRVHRWPDEKVLTITDEDSDEEIEQTAAEWAAAEGPGLIGSTCW